MVDSLGPNYTVPACRGTGNSDQQASQAVTDELDLVLLATCARICLHFLQGQVALDRFTCHATDLPEPVHNAGA